VQVYLSYPNAAVDPKIPAKVLRYFKKVCAGDAQEMTTMSFSMTDRDVSPYDSFRDIRSSQRQF
jgi:hypothetical protein